MLMLLGEIMLWKILKQYCLLLLPLPAPKLNAPYLGEQTLFSHPVKTVLIGALAHGVGLSLYRISYLFKKYADLIVHVLLSEVEAFFERFGKYPVIYFLCCVVYSRHIGRHLLRKTSPCRVRFHRRVIPQESARIRRSARTPKMEYLINLY